MPIKKAPVKRNQLIKRSEIVNYFEWLKGSPKVKSLQGDVLGSAAEIGNHEGEQMPVYIDGIKGIIKKAEAERGKIGDIANEVKKLNQGIYQEIINKAKEVLKSAMAKYNAWLRDEEIKRREIQRQLEVEAAAKRKEFEAAREVGTKKGEPALPEIIIPTPVVADAPIDRSIARKDIRVEVTEILSFIQHVARAHDPELLDCIGVIKTAGIKAKAKRNPGKVEIPGVEITYYPTDSAWGIKPKEE